MTDVARTVSVRLEAQVAKYIADIRAAGAATDSAFRGSTRSSNDLDRSVTRTESSMGRLRTTTERTRPSVVGLGRDVDRTGRSLDAGSRGIDRYSGRLGLIAQAVAVLGPGLVPIAAVGIPAVTGLATQLGFAAAGAGAMVLAFQGVGDALKAVNKAELQPTVENLQAAKVAMQNLSPEARDFVNTLHGLKGTGTELRNAAAGGFFPGLTQSLDILDVRVPETERIVNTLGHTVGDMIRKGAKSLASSEWDDFFDFLQNDARSNLKDTAQAAGNLAHALASLVVASDPLSDDFSGWLVDATHRLDQFTSGLDESASFQEFIAYVETNGPQVADTLGAVAQAGLDIVEAAAPLGGPVLKGLEAVAKVVSAIADSDLGTPLFAGLAAMTLFTRATQLWGSSSVVSARQFVAGQVQAIGALGQVTSAQQRAQLSATELEASQRRVSVAGRGAILKSGAMLAGLAIASSGAADSIGLTNTVSLALMGTMAGPWGAAIGAGTGLVLDWVGSQDQAKAAAQEFTDTLDQQTGAITDNTRELAVKKLADSGALDAAQQLGLNLSVVTDAALGNADAIASVNAQLDAFGVVAQTAGRGGSVSGGGQFAGAAEKVRSVLGQTNSELDASRGLWRQHDAAIDHIGGSYTQAASAAEEFANAVERVNQLLAKRASKRDFEAAIDDLTKSLKENGHSLDINTAKGRANQAALDQIASTALKVAKSLKGSNRIEFLHQARHDFLDAAEKLDMGDRAAKRLATRLGLVGRTKAKPVIDVDTDDARTEVRSWEEYFAAAGRQRAEPEIQVRADAAYLQIAAIRSQLASIDHTTVYAEVGIHRLPGASGFGAQVNAAGGLYSSVDRANGHMPHITKKMRVFGEPETKGEAYTPLANDWRRPRAKAITEQVVDRFGGSVKWHVAGDFNASPDMRRATGGGGAGVGVLVGRAVVDLRTPWGTQQVEVLMSNIARAEIDADADYRSSRGGR